MAIFANSLTHKVHQRDEYAYISNFIFSNLLGSDYVPTYAIIEGNGATWEVSTNKDLSFTVNADAGKISGIEVDGKAVDAADYTVEGSTITLDAEYLQGLKSGKHTVTVLLTDGSADGSFTVSMKSPATGDSFNAMLWICLMGMTAMAGAALLCTKKQTI